MHSALLVPSSFCLVPNTCHPMFFSSIGALRNVFALPVCFSFVYFWFTLSTTFHPIFSPCGSVEKNHQLSEANCPQMSYSQVWRSTLLCPRTPVAAVGPSRGPILKSSMAAPLHLHSLQAQGHRTSLGALGSRDWSPSQQKHGLKARILQKPLI